MSEPAFPGVLGQSGFGNVTCHINANGEPSYVEHNQGMTLLDYFAAQALVGLLAYPHRSVGKYGELAEVAHNYAEAMLAEREKRCTAQSAKK